jgi:hypothetical protein
MFTGQATLGTIVGTVAEREGIVAPTGFAALWTIEVRRILDLRKPA